MHCVAVLTCSRHVAAVTSYFGAAWAHYGLFTLRTANHSVIMENEWLIRQSGRCTYSCLVQLLFPLRGSSQCSGVASQRRREEVWSKTPPVLVAVSSARCCAIGAACLVPCCTTSAACPQWMPRAVAFTSQSPPSDARFLAASAAETKVSSLPLEPLWLPHLWR